MIQPKEMPCQEVVALVTEYLEGALQDPDRRRFDEHLAECLHCVVHLEQMRITIGLVGRLRAR